MGLCACSQGASVAQLTASTLQPQSPTHQAPRSPAQHRPCVSEQAALPSQAPSLSVEVPFCPIRTSQGLLSLSHRGRGSLLRGACAPVGLTE